MSDVVRVLDEHPVDSDAGREIRKLVDTQGGIATLREGCEAIVACQGDNYYPFLWPFYKSHRSTVFRMVELLELTSTSEDGTLRSALNTVLAHRTSRSEWVDDAVDLAFANQQWRRTVLVPQEGGLECVHRQHLELCVFSSLANELKSGDIAVSGSELFADYRTQLLPWSDCEPMLKEFCEQMKLPENATDFVATLRARLTKCADLADRAYHENLHLVIGEDGIPVLKKHRAVKPPKSAVDLEGEVLKRMHQRSVTEILCDVRYWTNWSRHFGPLSGSDPKLENAAERYIQTSFTYGCNLGPAQAARHFRGAVSEHQLSFVNRRHIDSNKLSAACRDILDSYSGLKLPRLWGDGSAAAADGTKYELYDQNLLASRHIRYGGWGGIAYHHTSNNYGALFSHFIPCGIWEAIYIIDGLLKNTSKIQPRTVHADTQGQSLPVFGLCHMLGILLMPRIRNWKDYRFFRPESDAEYENIDKLFRDTMDWTLIETHWQDLMQVALSIKAGKITASTILRKLGNYSRQNRLYRAFKELGAAVRTMFLLQYISDEDLRKRITAETNKVEAYNGFAKYFFFGGEGIIADNDPIEQEKAIKYNDLVCNAIIFYNAVEQTRIIKALIHEGWKVTREDVALLSPYVTSHIKRFGDFIVNIDETPDPYDPEFPLE